MFKRDISSRVKSGLKTSLAVKRSVLVSTLIPGGKEVRNGVNLGDKAGEVAKRGLSGLNGVDKTRIVLSV